MNQQTTPHLPESQNFSLNLSCSPESCYSSSPSLESPTAPISVRSTSTISTTQLESSGPLIESEFEQFLAQNYGQIPACFRSEMPYAYIVEQPAKCGVRFRYECEGRISTAIPGANASATRYTSPTIAVANYQGPVKVVVSCVTKNAPYRAHPHNLVGKKFCQDGISVSIFLEPYCEFSNLGILCAKRRDIRDRLRLREQLKVDPFESGFDHKVHAFKSIDLSALRLCFEVYLFDPCTGAFTHRLEPLVSDEIHDRKAINELSIVRLSHDSSPTSGGGTAILLCERVSKDDIQIRFFRQECGIFLWQAVADFRPTDIHKQFAISFTIPPYTPPLEPGHQGVSVSVQLYRPSDGCTSELLPFYYFTDLNMIPTKEDAHQTYYWPAAASTTDQSFTSPYTPIDHEYSLSSSTHDQTSSGIMEENNNNIIFNL